AARRGPSPERHADATTSVLVMTRLVPEKNVDVVIRALALCPDATLVIAGDGPERDALQRLATSLGVDARTRFAGWVSGEAKEALLDQADVYCLPTTGDSFGLGFIEAMARGVPVVAAHWGPIPDVVPDQIGGLLARDT